MPDFYDEDERLFLALEDEGGFVSVVTPTTPINGYVAEDGVTNYVAEDGATFYVQEV